MLWGNYIYRPYYKRQDLAGLANCGYSTSGYALCSYELSGQTTGNSTYIVSGRCFPTPMRRVILLMLSLRISIPNRCYNCHIRCQPKSSVNSRRRASSQFGYWRDFGIDCFQTKPSSNLVEARARPTRRYVRPTSHTYSADTTQV